MKIILIKTLCMIVLIFLTVTLKAQIQKPIAWSYAAKKISATEVELYVKATIEKGWHIYSVNQKAGGPEKTMFSFEKSKDFSLVGKVVETKPIKKFEEVFGIDVLYFEKSVVFTQRIKLNTKDPFTVKGKVAFMACTNQQCLPTDEVSFSIPIK